MTLKEINDGKDGLYCSFEENLQDQYLATGRLKNVWKQAIIRQLGADHSVNGERLFILFQDEDYECIYPGQILQDKGAWTG